MCSELRLGGNPISTIEDGAFRGLVSLEELLLRDVPLIATELNLTGATLLSLRQGLLGRGGFRPCCTTQGPRIILNDALLSHDSFEAILGSWLWPTSVSIVGLRFADENPSDLSALLGLESLEEVTVDATLFEMYENEFRAFDAIDGNTVTVAAVPQDMPAGHCFWL
jgi:hypothetical protein